VEIVCKRLFDRSSRPQPLRSPVDRAIFSFFWFFGLSRAFDKEEPKGKRLLSRLFKEHKAEMDPPWLRQRKESCQTSGCSTEKKEQQPLEQPFFSQSIYWRIRGFFKRSLFQAVAG
jgi:hypothetical protein